MLRVFSVLYVRRLLVRVVPLLLLTPALAQEPGHKVSDPKGDYGFGRVHPELDITAVSFSRLSAQRIRVTVAFADKLPTKRATSPYRLWLQIDLDNDPGTGQLGNDLSVAINGASPSEKWTTYSVPKSDVGEKSDVRIQEIKVRPGEISFVITGRVAEPNSRAHLSIDTCWEASRVVDRVPDRGMTPLVSEAQ